MPETSAMATSVVLEIAMGLVQDPRLFILDEPTQGLAETEVDDFVALINALAGDTTILLIEHNMDVVMRTANYIHVLDNGQSLASGTPDEIRNNAAVQAAYLGERMWMLELKDIHAAYGRVKVLHGVSLTAKAGEIHCLLGRNGAGKTTVMKAIMGLVPLTAGSIELDGESLRDLPAHEVPKRRVGYVPQGRRLFPELSVSENIDVGLMTCNASADTRDWVLDIFPPLKDRLSQQANTLSGGEQQMLATARRAVSAPTSIVVGRADRRVATFDDRTNPPSGCANESRRRRCLVGGTTG